MKKKLIILGVAGFVIAGCIAAYLFFMPHRDVQSSEAFATVNYNVLVEEYLKDITAANNKYLSEDGDSKVLVIEGPVFSINEDAKGQQMVLLKKEGDKAGVGCTFLLTSGDKAKALKVGQNVKVKGYITSGPGYDEDLEMYMDATIKDCALVE